MKINKQYSSRRVSSVARYIIIKYSVKIDTMKRKIVGKDRVSNYQSGIVVRDKLGKTTNADQPTTNIRYRYLSEDWYEE